MSGLAAKQSWRLDSLSLAGILQYFTVGISLLLQIRCKGRHTSLMEFVNGLSSISDSTCTATIGIAEWSLETSIMG